MKTFFLKFSITLFLLCISLSNCSKPTLTGWGEDADIYVLADSTIWKPTESSIRKAFEIEIITPQTETIFTINKATLDNFKRYKNIIFLATLNDSGEVSTIVKSRLSQDAIQKVKDDVTYIFMQKEEWATEQIIMFLVAPDIETLNRKITENSEYLFNLVNEYWNEINKKRMFLKNEQVAMEKELLKKYGWMVRVPYDYEMFIHKPDSNFLMLRRMLPERWLFVHWIDTDDPSVVNSKWYIKKRDRFGKLFYEGDKIEQKFVTPDTAIVNFQGKRALKVSGLWRNDIKQAGGPFIGYCFYDEKDARIYMLDYAIFQPRLKDSKRNYLRQAEIMLHTFKTNSEISMEDL